MKHSIAMMVIMISLSSCILAGMQSNEPMSSNQATKMLSKAFLTSNIDGVMQAITAGADVNAKYYANASLLHYQRLPQAALLLIEHGADVHAQCYKRRTPLFYVESLLVAQALVEKGAQINFQDVDGNSPLHYAAFQDHPQIVSFLLQNGARQNIPNRFGQVAKQVTKFYSTYKILEDFPVNLEKMNLFQESDYSKKLSGESLNHVKAYLGLPNSLSIVARQNRKRKSTELSAVPDAASEN